MECQSAGRENLARKRTIERLKPFGSLIDVGVHSLAVIGWSVLDVGVDHLTWNFLHALSDEHWQKPSSVMGQCFAKKMAPR
jgi:hypothetical protein